MTQHTSMEALMELARKHADQVEIRTTKVDSNKVSYADAKLDEIDTTFRQSVRLRLLKDGKQGFAVTHNLIDMDELVQQALLSLGGDVDAPFDLPLTKDVSELDTYDPAIENLTNTDIVTECERVCAFLTEHTDSEVNVSTGSNKLSNRLLNSKGTDLHEQTSSYYMWAQAGYPGGATGVHRIVSEKAFAPMPADQLNTITSLYNQGETLVRPADGRMQVLFMPMAQVALLWRVTLGLNGSLVYRKVSPLLERMGEQVVSPLLTIYNDPLDDSLPGASAFDNEGMPTRKLTLFDHGKLSSFYYDLKYAAKCNAKPTGTSGPELHHLRIASGQQSVQEMIAGMKRGILLEGTMGAHSGNLVAGDYSVGVAPAFYVEDGRIVGRVLDAMVAGNAYETLSNVVALSRECGYGHNGTSAAHIPAMLCEDVSVTIKK